MYKSKTSKTTRVAFPGCKYYKSHLIFIQGAFFACFLKCVNVAFMLSTGAGKFKPFNIFFSEQLFVSKTTPTFCGRV